MNQRERLTTMNRESILAWVTKWYHVPVLVGLVAYMFWNRARTWERFVIGDKVYFSGNDAWYHFRQTTYTVHNWPNTMPFEPWTNFPMGTATGQFGTFYDQIVATVALIVGLGSPDQQTIALTLLFAPAVFGALTAVPIYLIARRISGRIGGLAAVFVLALTGGAFLQRSLVGFSDHHAPEAFFQAVAILGMIVALAIAKEEKPVFELITGRETRALRRPAVGAVLAGVAIAMYIWVWPPGIMIGAIFAAFFIVQLTLDYLRGRSPEHTAIVGFGALVIAALLVTARISTFSFHSTAFTLLQPALLLLVAVGLVVMSAIARGFDARSIDRRFYPIVIFGGVTLAVGAAAVLVPDLYSQIVSQALRFIGLASGAAQRTISEAQPLSMDPNNSSRYWATVLGDAYELAFYMALLGLVVALVRSAITDDTQPGLILVVVWGVFMLFAVFTQLRFNYYFALPVAVLAGYLVGTVAEFIGVDVVSKAADLKAHQVMTVFLVLFLIVAPFVALPGQAGSQQFGLKTAQTAEANGPGNAVIAWESSLSWMMNNTPEEGRYDDPGAKPMEYYGTYEPTDDFDYPPGAYGVMAWWDYGHWITVLGERIPDANPFQQGARKAADFLLATNESNATAVIDGKESTRYVMVDWQIVNRYSKYHAPAQFESNDTVTPSDLAFWTFRSKQNGQGYQRYVKIPTQRHLESMRSRMYLFNGSAVEPSPTVIDWEEQPVRGGMTIPVITNESFKQFDNMSAARAYVENDGSSQIGMGTPAERIPALKHYRMVHASKATGPQRYVQGQPWLKTFERVPGATVTGSGPANSTVTASVEMRMPTTGGTFTYRQHAETDEEGQFTMTLPYSTTGYENWGPESGHTDVSVRANGPYTFSTNTGPNATDVWTGTANVTEAQVIGEENTSVEVTLEQSDTSSNDSDNTSSAVDTTEMRTGDSGGTSDDTGEAPTQPVLDHGVRMKVA